MPSSTSHFLSAEFGVRVTLEEWRDSDSCILARYQAYVRRACWSRYEYGDTRIAPSRVTGENWSPLSEKKPGIVMSGLARGELERARS
jgi:hypothetical protein